MEHTHMQPTATPRISVQNLCMTGVLTAVTIILAQISIPMPLGVPMTMQTFAITLAAMVLGSKYGALSSLVYLLLGMVGLPVFSNFTGGISRLVGPTGGFLISFPLMAFLIGLGIEYRRKFRGALVLFVILGTVVNYLFGLAMYCLLTANSFAAGFTACVAPFIPTAIIKAVLAVILGLAIRRRLPG